MSDIRKLCQNFNPLGECNSKEFLFIMSIVNLKISLDVSYDFHSNMTEKITNARLNLHYCAN